MNLVGFSIRDSASRLNFPGVCKEFSGETRRIFHDSKNYLREVPMQYAETTSVESPKIYGSNQPVKKQARNNQP